VGGLTAQYSVLGQGAPALFLHGWGCNISLMEPVAQQLAGLRTCYVVDFPGFGGSAAPGEAWSVEEYTAWLAQLMDTLGIDRADIIAHSFGGRVAIRMGSAHPQRVNKIIITGGAGLIPKRTLKYHIKVRAYKLGKAIRRCAWLNACLKKLGLDLDKKAASAGSEDYKALSGVMKQTFVRVVNQNLRPYLKQITAPTLLVWGENDTAAPLYFGQIMSREIPDAGLVVFEGDDHFAYLHQLGRFAAIASNFLGG